MWGWTNITTLHYTATSIIIYSHKWKLMHLVSTENVLSDIYYLKMAVLLAVDSRKKTLIKN